MAEMAGMLAAGALKVAAGKMAEAAGDRIMQQWSFGEDLEDMKNTVESIEAVLEDAEKKSVQDKTTQLWLERLTQASYNISDMFDEFEVDTTRKSALRKLKILNPCLTLASEVRMASKMKKVKKTLDKIADERHKYNALPTSSPSRDQQLVTSPEVIEAKIFGRDREKHKIITLLTKGSTSSDFVVLPIYGMGGIGKTTLAQLLFNDTYFKDYEKAWVHVSQTFQLNTIKESVRSQLQLKQGAGRYAPRQEQDAGGFSPKCILIVLDDLWETNELKLDEMSDSLQNIVGNGHKVHVIVTTRDASIAIKAQTIQPHNIQALSDDVCWEIIKQKSNFEHKNDKERLEVIGKEIAKKCGGVALAARAIGCILKSRRDVHGWVSVKDSGIWNVSSSGYSPYDNVLASLKLSYNNMLAQLRLCFTYCAVFPKGHKMAKDELIYQWAALGFIKSSDKFSTWQHGEDCINQLLDMSFLDHAKSPSVDGKQHKDITLFIMHEKQHKDITLFTMHDLVHDLARMIMGDEVLDASEKSKFGGSKCRYAFLANCSKPLNSFVKYPDKIRALRFFGSGGTGCCHAGFCTAKYLRILDFGECSLKKLPSSIGQLRLLRHLNAPGILDQNIPICMTKLSKLHYLNLSGSRGLLRLPESIGRMEGLEYLDLSGCERIKMLPESFGKLENLAHLNLSKCKSIEMLPESFGKLENLAYLDLLGCMQIEMLPESFAKLQNLVHLDLSYCSRLKATTVGALRGLTKVQHLNLSDCPSLSKELHEVIGELTDELRYLNLSGCWFDSYLQDEVNPPSGAIDRLFDKISTLSNLEHLDLSYNRFVSLPDSLCSLRKLRTLDLTYCGSLRKLPRNMGHMDSLKFLIMDYCFSLNMSTLPVNKNLIALPKFVVHAAEEGEQSSNLIVLKDASPSVLDILCLENVMFVEEARGIELRDKKCLVDLTLDWTRGEKGFVEDMELLRELVPPSSLTQFSLRGYNSMSFPAWIHSIALYLPNLIEVCLESLSQCSSLPPLGQLPNLKFVYLQGMPHITKIDRGFCGDGMLKAFTHLGALVISNMENLEEWSTTYSCDEGGTDEFMFPNLGALSIISCPKFRVGPCPPRVRSTWWIEGSDSVLLQWEESAPHQVVSSTSTTALVGTLEVRSCQEPMHEWKLLYHLHGLHGLKIVSCDDLSSSPEITRVLASLQSLSLWAIHALPQWLGDCVSLKELEIRDCGVMSFPESIQQLTNLESISVRRCPELHKWIEMKENKTKIGHIKQINLLD